MSPNLDKLDSVEERIEAIKESLADAGGEVSPDKVFNEGFMAEHTDHGSLSSFYEESPRDLGAESNLTQVDDAGFDAYVSDNSVFRNWDSMVNKAARDHVEGQFGN